MEQDKAKELQQIRERFYSGPGKSGICKCGHSWKIHHLCIKVNPEAIEESHEGYLPGPCLYYGSNECEGYGPNGEDHCWGYEDRGGK